MDEWQVFLALGVILSFIISVAKPLIQINTNSTEQKITLNRLEKIVTDFINKHEKTHSQIDDKLHDYDKRITDLERDKEK